MKKDMETRKEEGMEGRGEEERKKGRKKDNNNKRKKKGIMKVIRKGREK